MEESRPVPAGITSEQLSRARVEFGALLESEGARAVWANFPGRSAIALSGGGARGAYQAGALLAFQDAQLPTHIIAATSIGSINAAGYAGNSDSLVGNAEAVVEHWLGVTPTLVGIEWTRYAWMLGGLIAFWAGVGNLMYAVLASEGYAPSLRDPKFTWTLLGLAGLVMLLLYDHLPYVTFIGRSMLAKKTFKIQVRKAALSVLGNAVVVFFIVALLGELNFVRQFGLLVALSPLWAAGMVALVGLLLLSRRYWRLPVSGLM